MGAVLNKKPTLASSESDLLNAILKLATTKLARLMLREDNEWKDQRLKEIARITRLLKRKRRQATQ